MDTSQNSQSQELEVVYEPSEGQVQELYELYVSYEWWEDRKLEDMYEAVENTDEVVCLEDKKNGVVAGGRVLTDYVYYSRIYDVIVDQDFRREGVGKRIMREIVEHPRLQSLDRFVLSCREGLIPFYERCGFEVFDMEVEYQDQKEDLVLMVYRAEEEEG